ncbi:drosomycin-like [Belonocnema kinseyi]|uniref:drosomycin-like n=1 Tax=Belonocnema kinseyi TaxID=2817044 RepID=UPI00143CF1CB|nr:drosomycin-like [Belonocnema kinseyi]XP_033211664.1 drosomycin-like [Belonocnema kinseyi]
MRGILLISVLAFIIMAFGIETIMGDCPSGQYSGPCLAWDGDTCRRVCIESGGTSGHCSASTKCWCENGGC